MTGGGTESIISAVFAVLAHQAEKKGIVAPEIVMAGSAHPAFRKAARYSGARHVPQSGVMFVGTLVGGMPNIPDLLGLFSGRGTQQTKRV